MTISPQRVLAGLQKPRVLTRPDFHTEVAGSEAVDLAHSVGLHLDPWQQLLVNLTLAEDAGGLYAADTVAALVARQNGKGGWLEAVTLHGMFLVGDPLTLWTAHQFKTSTEAFLRLRSWIDGSDDLRRKVRRMNAAHGEEGIELHSGARLRFLCRSKSSGRGFSPQRIIFDEAQELSALAVAAMVPSMRAQRNKQAIYTGTVPGPDINHPEQFTRIRDRGREGKSRRLAWAEWSPAGSEDPNFMVDLDSRRAWAEANPARGYRVTDESLESDRETLSDEDFAREALSVWPDSGPEQQGVIDLEAWAELRNPAAKQPKRAVLAIDVSPDRRSASIAVAGAGSDGKTLLMVRHGTGSKWVVPEVVKLVKKRDVVDVVLHPQGQAGALIPDLITAEIAYTTLTSTDLGQATAKFLTDIDHKALEHVGQPELDAAVGNARTRMSSEAELWDRRKPGVDISPLVAVSEASFRWASEADSEPSAFFI